MTNATTQPTTVSSADLAQVKLYLLGQAVELKLLLRVSNPFTSAHDLSAMFHR